MSKKKTDKGRHIGRIDVMIATELFLLNKGVITRLEPQSVPTATYSYNAQAYMDDDADKFLMETYG